MNIGSIALARIQQTDGRLKLPPIVMLSKMFPYSDLLVCVVSSKLRHEVKDFDDVIETNAADYKFSGLKVSSLIRLGLLAMIPRSAIAGEIGNISKERLIKLRKRLAEYIKAKPKNA